MNCQQSVLYHLITSFRLLQAISMCLPNCLEKKSVAIFKCIKWIANQNALNPNNYVCYDLFWNKYAYTTIRNGILANEGAR